MGECDCERERQWECDGDSEREFECECECERERECEGGSDVAEGAQMVVLGWQPGEKLSSVDFQWLCGFSC